MGMREPDIERLLAGCRQLPPGSFRQWGKANPVANPSPQPYTRNPEPQTLNPQTLNPQPPTFNPQPITLNLKPSTSNPQP